VAERVFRLYDSLTKKVIPLETGEPGRLKFYSCGPTVYSYAHIGNFRSFLTADLIVRTAKVLGWRVTWVTNITDVGHLTEDDVADAVGEDKMERALRSKEGEHFANVWELAEYYTEAYKQDWRALNLTEPTIRPKATQHVSEQIRATEALIASGHAYQTPDAVYFRVSSFPEYGKLSGNTQENLRRGVREVVVDANKEDPADFAIWKKDDRHLMQWFSPFGWGFPGWHIECSVMAREYLGDTIDLHSGGEDNMFPHHECEIAQSESLTGKPFSRHWVHTRFLQVNGEKMAKSAGNFYTVRGLMEKGFDPLAIRLALIGGVYGKPLNFTDQGLIDAMGNIDRIRRAQADVREALAAERPGDDRLGESLDELADEALSAMLDDLNTAIAVAKVLEGVRMITRAGGELSAASARAGERFLATVDSLLGIVPSAEEAPKPADSGVDSALIEARIAERATAKKDRDFARADAIRAELDAQGIELRDTPEGTEWALKRTLSV